MCPEEKKKKKKKKRKKERKKSRNAVRMLRLCAKQQKIQKKHSETGDPISTAEKDFFFYNSKKKKKNLSLRFPCGLQYSRFFSPKKRKKKRIRAFAKLQLKLWLNKNWTQLTTVTRIGFFQPGKEVNSNWKKYETFFLSFFLNQREGEKKLSLFFFCFKQTKKKNNRSTKIVSRTRSSLLIFFSFSKKGKKKKDLKRKGRVLRQLRSGWFCQ